MSWSISASGKRAEVKEAIDRQVNPDNYFDGNSKLEIERANRGLHSLLESTKSTHASMSGYGSLGGPVSVSISAWSVQDEPAPAPTAAA